MITVAQSTDQGRNQPVYNLTYVWMISLVAAMGGLLFGYDWVVIGGAKPFFEKYFQLTTEAQSGWANSCALIGCLLGSQRQVRPQETAHPRRVVVRRLFRADGLGIII
jgi:MFS family permease